MPLDTPRHGAYPFGPAPGTKCFVRPPQTRLLFICTVIPVQPIRRKPGPHAKDIFMAEAPHAAYVIGHISVKDADQWAAYRSAVPATLAPWQAELVLRGTLLQAAATGVIAWAPNVYVAVPAMVLGGMAWITTANTL
eukprot:gene19084-24389_t